MNGEIDGTIGEIRLFAGNRPPTGWLECNGQSLAIDDYQQLYQVIGKTYGDQEDRFQIPDLRGRVVVGAGSGPSLTPRHVGGLGGTAQVILQTPDLPRHNHVIRALAQDATLASPAGAMLARPSGLAGTTHFAKSGSSALKLAALDFGSIGGTGGGAAHNNLMPYQSIMFIIAHEGQFPDAD